MSEHIQFHQSTYKFTLSVPSLQTVIDPIKNMIVSIYDKYFNFETAKKNITYYMYIAYVSFLLISFVHSVRIGFMYDSYTPHHIFDEIKMSYANNFKNHVLIALKWPWGALSYLITNLASIITMRKTITCYTHNR